MPRGKPFICWLSTEGHYHDVAVHIGDIVEFHSFNEGWVRAKIGCKRNGPYVCRWGRQEETVFLMTRLRPAA